MSRATVLSLVLLMGCLGSKTEMRTKVFANRVKEMLRRKCARNYCQEVIFLENVDRDLIKAHPLLDDILVAKYAVHPGNFNNGISQISQRDQVSVLWRDVGDFLESNNHPFFSASSVEHFIVDMSVSPDRFQNASLKLNDKVYFLVGNDRVEEIWR